MASVPPPALEVTTNVIGFTGYDSAQIDEVPKKVLNFSSGLFKASLKEREYYFST